MPVDLYLEASRHTAEIVREFALISFGDRSGVNERVPDRLLELVVRLTEDITEALDAADEFCRSGHLLTLDAPPEVVAWRHWWRDQILGQIRDGIEPSPFPMPAEA